MFVALTFSHAGGTIQAITESAKRLPQSIAKDELVVRQKPIIPSRPNWHYSTFTTPIIKGR